MRDLLSLDPKIHGLRTHTKEARRLADGQRVLRVTRAAALEDSGDGGTVVADGRFVFGVNVHGVPPSLPTEVPDEIEESVVRVSRVCHYLTYTSNTTRIDNSSSRTRGP
jgi:hypothetical protein